MPNRKLLRPFKTLAELPKKPESCFVQSARKPQAARTRLRPLYAPPVSLPEATIALFKAAVLRQVQVQ